MIGWALLELMGHVSHVGEVSEVEIAGQRFVSIETLEFVGERRVLCFNPKSVFSLELLSAERAREMRTSRPNDPLRRALAERNAKEYDPFWDDDAPPQPVVSYGEPIEFEATSDSDGDIAFSHPGMTSPLKPGAEYMIVAKAANGTEKTFSEIADADGDLICPFGGFLVEPNTTYSFTAREVVKTMPEGK